MRRTASDVAFEVPVKHSSEYYLGSPENDRLLSKEDKPYI